TFDEYIDKHLTGNQKIGSNWYENKDWVTYSQFVEDDFSDDGSDDDYQEDIYELDYDFDNDAKSIFSLREKANHFGYCKVCARPNLSYDWCNSCNRKILEVNFAQWNSGDDNINEFIRETQRKANKHLNYIEWVEFDSITNMTYLATGGFGIVYTAKLTDEVQKKSIKAVRFHAGDKVVLKALKNSQFMSKEFLNELQNYHQCFGNDMNAHLHIFGITYDPNNIEYMMVLKFAKGGDLRSILRQNHRKISWRDRIELLYGISQQLLTIHNKDVIHRDLHAGNILFDNKFYERDFFRRIYIADLGLARPCYRPHTTGKVPFRRNVFNQDALLQCAIWDGERPNVPKDTPKPWVELMKRCWQGNPNDRPTTRELFETTESWYFFKEDYTEFKDADERQSALLYAANLQYNAPPEHTQEYQEFQNERSTSIKYLQEHQMPMIREQVQARLRLSQYDSNLDDCAISDNK
ncbi:8029_t:CDS:2, partial [Ambispora leptoticha]